MAKKRVRKKIRVPKKVKRVSRRSVRRVARTKSATRKVRSTSKRIKTATWNLIFFVVLSALVVLLTKASSNQMYIDLFFILSVLLGVVALAFFIALLVLVFLKIFGK